ncbi:bifunctional diguanylate cyclase/phosphodiesterase [Gilvimarinus polysaccharolyticus]|uniref:bifunctional diguanylate cyclase/phosphodiesterase n=1 Tax=Gilvimarinus polysaccharolyticus TaxID=863921 RepID=UPI0006737162|nr:EAL domain-containing protein [Gilvimarinus polysaccharolyticus]
MTLENLKRNPAAKWALTICVALLLVATAVEVMLERYFHQSEIFNKQQQVSQQLDTHRAKLVGAINNNLSLISGFAAYIGAHPNLSQAEFEHYAAAVFRQEPLLINISAAPNLITHYVYPPDKNKAILGLDYRDYPHELAVIKTLTQPGTLNLAGPLILWQGPEAVIGRAPVFTDNNTFWGVVSAPMMTQDLYRAAGLLEDEPSVEIAIRGRDGLGEQGEVFYGHGEVFTDPHSVVTTLNIAGGGWQLAARPLHGWVSNNPVFWLLRCSFIIIALMLITTIAYRYRQIRRDFYYRRSLQENEALLREAGKLALVGGWRLSPEKDRLILSHWSEQTANTLHMAYQNSPPTLAQILATFDANQAKALKLAIIAATHGTPFDLELYYISKNTGKCWTRIIGKPILEGTQPFSVLGSMQDITERKHFTNKIQQQAIYDQLTGLPNRFLFQKQLNKAITTAQRNNTKLAILFIDLDNFKPVNDNLGHTIGDHLLKCVGDRIKACIRSSDTVARYSGDEFIVILHDIYDVKVSVSIAEQIIKAISQVYTIGENHVFCGASVGISIYPDDGDNAEPLVSKADQAMYGVKRSGRNGWQFFTRNMQVVSEKRHVLSTQLVTAMENQEFCVYYQPIIDLNDNHIGKCEALVRWFRNGKQIPTDEFITLAEETGRINEIDRFVLATASEQLITLSQKLEYPLSLSINVSPRVFSSKDDSLDRWLALITQASKQLDITVEITERLLIEESDRIMWVLTKLKSLGITIAIDDFGTGYSSLSYLTKFPIDIIKIDQSFIKKLGQEATPEALTETMIGLSHKLNLEVVAEGIETLEQLNYLRSWHCDYGQGYYFNKPLPAEQFVQLIEQEKLKATNLTPFPNL